MRPLTQLRAETPHDEFISRPLPCPDGSIHLMVMPSWFWDKFDLLLQEKFNLNFHDTIEFCFGLAEETVAQAGWDLDIAFRQLLMYYIYRNFCGYMAEQQGLANDNWEDFFNRPAT